jgi:putative NADH-flavin reductase
MKLAIFGGTGRTGLLLVRQALEKGYEVSALARTPSKLDIQNDKLTVISGDVTKAEAVARTLTGTEAALSVLGPADNAPTFTVSRGMAHIVAAMQTQGIRRLIVTAGAGVSDPLDAPGPLNHIMSLLLKLVAKNVLADMSKVVDTVRASDLDWTIVRLPMLTDDPQTSQPRVGYVGRGMGARIGRAAIAAFMLGQISDTTYLRKSPVISQ